MRATSSAEEDSTILAICKYLKNNTTLFYPSVGIATNPERFTRNLPKQVPCRKLLKIWLLTSFLQETPCQLYLAASDQGQYKKVIKIKSVPLLFLQRVAFRRLPVCPRKSSATSQNPAEGPGLSRLAGKKHLSRPTYMEQSLLDCLELLHNSRAEFLDH